MKSKLSLCLLTLVLANCGGGSSDSSGDAGTGGAETGTNTCSIENNALALTNGQQCELSNEAATTYNTTAGTISCADNRVTFGGLTAGSLSLNGLSVTCGE